MCRFASGDKQGEAPSGIDSPGGARRALTLSECHLDETQEAEMIWWI